MPSPHEILKTAKITRCLQRDLATAEKMSAKRTLQAKHAILHHQKDNDLNYTSPGDGLIEPLHYLLRHLIISSSWAADCGARTRFQAQKESHSAAYPNQSP